MHLMTTVATDEASVFTINDISLPCVTLMARDEHGVSMKAQRHSCPGPPLIV